MELNCNSRLNELADNSVTSAKIVNGADNAVNGDLAQNSIAVRHIPDGLLQLAEIAANTIATGNIADNAIDGTKIAQNSILTKHIDDAQVILPTSSKCCYFS